MISNNKKLVCDVCNHSWFSTMYLVKKELPIQCPKCKSPSWNRNSETITTPDTTTTTTDTIDDKKQDESL